MLPLCLCALILSASQASASPTLTAHKKYSDKHWAQSAKPEDQGWSSEKLAAAKAYADTLDTAAVIVVDDGVIVSQWGATDTKFNVHSIRKSYLSALFGIAVAKGQIDLNAPLDQLRIDDNRYPPCLQGDAGARTAFQPLTQLLPNELPPNNPRLIVERTRC